LCRFGARDTPPFEPTWEVDLQGDRIADLRSTSGSLISVYASRPSPGGFGALLSDLVKPIREKSVALDRRVQKSVRADTDRIHELASDLEMDSAPGYAIFASDIDGTFVLEALGHPAPNLSTIGPRPYMRPLRASPRPIRSGIIVADRASARTFVAMGGIVDEVYSEFDADIGKRDWGGFSGYEEHTVRSRADEMTSKLWREAGETLSTRHGLKPFDYLAIGSQEETVEEIARTLHPYLARLQRATFTASPSSIGLPALRAEVEEMDAIMRRNRQEALAGRVCDTAWGGGNGIIGLAAVIDAANVQAVEALVVAGDFTRPGAICDSCGHLTRMAGRCPVCSEQLFGVDDIVGALMDAVVAAGGRVHQIDVASPLDREGVGALTRFPVPV
jgi:hypothetical protein